MYSTVYNLNALDSTFIVLSYPNQCWHTSFTVYSGAYGIWSVPTLIRLG